MDRKCLTYFKKTYDKLQTFVQVQNYQIEYSETQFIKFVHPEFIKCIADASEIGSLCHNHALVYNGEGQWKPVPLWVFPFDARSKNNSRLRFIWWYPPGLPKQGSNIYYNLTNCKKPLINTELHM